MDSEGGNDDLRAIRDRLKKPVTNPVTRARLMVERQVPVAKRGPGWDRHWRELEAYLEAPGVWSGDSDCPPFDENEDQAGL